MSDSDPCLACNEPLPDKKACPTCSECNYSYHFGTCSGVTKAAFKANAAKKNWKCQTCYVSAARGAEASNKRKQEQETAFESVLIEINKKLAEIPEIKSKVDDIILVKQTVEKMEHSVEHLSDQYDDVLKEMQRQSHDIDTLKKKVQKIEASSSGQGVQSLQRQVNNLEQYLRRQNLEIHGIPEAANETLLSTLHELAGKLELPEVKETDIDGLHRLPAKPGKIPAILVRFVSRKMRDNWMEKRGQLKANNSEVYFLDNLTPQTKKLLWMMKAKAAEMGYEYAWQRNGKLLVRRADGEPVIRVECEADLDKIC